MKKYLITTFALFGVMFSTNTIFANELPSSQSVSNVNVVDPTQKTKYLIEFNGKAIKQPVVQYFQNNADYQSRLTELKQSKVHTITGNTIVRNGNVDLIKTNIELNL